MKKDRGFEEIEHTADWALYVWAPDLPALLAEAARGMYSLMGLALQGGSRARREICLRAEDPESLLVAFLSELLFDCEQEALVYDRFEIEIENLALTACLEGERGARVEKEIKAVTFHNLAVRFTPQGLDVTLVFDV